MVVMGMGMTAQGCSGNVIVAAGFRKEGALGDSVCSTTRSCGISSGAQAASLDTLCLTGSVGISARSHASNSGRANFNRPSPSQSFLGTTTSIAHLPLLSPRAIMAVEAPPSPVRNEERSSVSSAEDVDALAKAAAAVAALAAAAAEEAEMVMESFEDFPSAADLARLEQARLDALREANEDLNADTPDVRTNLVGAALQKASAVEASKRKSRARARTKKLQNSLVREEKALANEVAEALLQEPPNLQAKPLEVVVKSFKHTARLAKRERAAATAQRKEADRLRPRQKERETAAGEDSVRTYLRQIGKSRLLTAKEEIECAQAVQDHLELERVRDYMAKELGERPSFEELADVFGQDPKEFQRRWNDGLAARERMVLCNLRLVVSIAKKYQGRGLLFQDLIQEGSMGLIRGVEKFDFSRGFKFSTYAHWWIRQAVTRAIADQSRTIRLPVHMFEAISKINKAKKQLFAELDREPTDDEIAELTGFTKDKVRLCANAQKLPVSLDSPLKADDKRKLEEVLVSDEPKLYEDDVDSAFMAGEMDHVLHTLNPRERDVLRLRYGLDDGRVKTLEEIGHVFQVTRERIRQIEAKALRKLRQPARNGVFREYMGDL